MKPLIKSDILSYNELALLNNSSSSCSSLWSWQFQFFCWKSRCSRHHQCHLKWTQKISCFDTGRKKKKHKPQAPYTILQSVLINLVGRKKKFMCMSKAKYSWISLCQNLITWEKKILKSHFKLSGFQLITSLISKFHVLNWVS